MISASEFIKWLAVFNVPYGGSPILPGYLPLTGGTMTGNLILNADATLALQAVTFQQLNAVISGLSPKAPCTLATTGALTGIYVNGVSGVGATFTFTATGSQTIDGFTTVLGYRVLMKDQAGANQLQNGIYTVSTLGGTGIQEVWTRAIDYNTSAEMAAGTYTIIESGTLNAGTMWYQTTTGTIVVGTSPILFTRANYFMAGNGIGITGNVLSAVINTTNLKFTAAAINTIQDIATTSSPQFAGLELGGSSSGLISILPQATAGTYNFNLPVTAGVAGYLLASGGGSAAPMTWTAIPLVSSIGGTGFSTYTDGQILVGQTSSTNLIKGSIGAGTGIGVSFNPSTGAFTISNTGTIGGITAVSGTANQVSVSTTSGVATVSLPANVYITNSLLVGGSSILTYIGLQVISTISSAAGTIALGLDVEPIFNCNSVTYVAGQYTAIRLSPPSGQTYTTAYGHWIDSGSLAGSGSITTSYGLYCSIQTAGTTRYTAYFQQGGVDITTTAKPTPNYSLNVGVQTARYANIVLSGNSMDANSSTDGIALMMAHNATGNRQLAIVDSTQTGSSSTNGMIRIQPNSGIIDYISTDLGTPKKITIGYTAGVYIPGVLGINTGLPDANSFLDVNGNINSTGFSVGGTGSNAYLIFEVFGRDNLEMFWDCYYNGTSIISNSSNGNFRFAKTSNLFEIDYSSTTAGSAISFLTGITLNTSGNVGIGDPSPATSLSVPGNFQVGFASGTVTSANGGAVSGKFGVGLSAPSAKFHVFDASSVPSGEIGSILLSGTTTSAPGIPRLAMGVNYSASAMNYAWIQAVENGVVGRPLILQGEGGTGNVVAIGSTSFVNSAVLSLFSSGNNAGFLMPLNSAPYTNISSPPTGLEVFNSLWGLPYFYNGSAWLGTAGLSFLETVSVTGGTVASITFTQSTALPITQFNTILILFQNLLPVSGGNALGILLSNNLGSSFLTSGYTGGVTSNNTGGGSTTWSNSSSTSSIILSAGFANAGAAAGHLFIRNLNYGTVQISGSITQGGVLYLVNCTQATAGINSFKVFFNSGNINTAVFTIYGMLGL